MQTRGQKTGEQKKHPAASCLILSAGIEKAAKEQLPIPFTQIPPLIYSQRCFRDFFLIPQEIDPKSILQSATQKTEV